MEERTINGKKYHYSCDVDGLCKEDGYPFTMEDLEQELDKAREEGREEMKKEMLDEVIMTSSIADIDGDNGVIKIGHKLSKLKQ